MTKVGDRDLTNDKSTSCKKRICVPITHQKRREIATPPQSSPMTKKRENSQCTAMPARPTRPEVMDTQMGTIRPKHWTTFYLE